SCSISPGGIRRRTTGPPPRSSRRSEISARNHPSAAAVAEPWRASRVAVPAVEAAMGFSLLEISIVMACISLLGFLIADNMA
ncbi:hypothetical protein, partial [Klebsiella pneumoniae]|uniref:hypothetical protein n=1 Tax=Klebsiella pneumoniae TaxID=573 RepID=UPI0025A9E5E8